MKLRLRYNSPVILTFTLAATAVLIIDSIQGGTFSAQFFAVHPTFQATKALSYLRLVTHVLGHQNWLHLMANFSFVLLIGPILEEKYGSLQILAMIVLTAVVTGILNVVFFPTPLYGASGVVFMLILLSSFTNFRAGDVPLTFVLVVALFLTKEVVDAVTREDEISQFAHIIGGICGGMFGFLTTSRREGRGKEETAPPREEAREEAPEELPPETPREGTSEDYPDPRSE